MALNPADIVPTLDAIGAHIKNFTRDTDGNLLGTFTADTVPNDEEAAAEALRAARYVATRIGSPSVEWTEDLLEMARDAASWYAALLIATGVTGDESEPDDSRLDQLGRISREQIAVVVAASKDDLPGGIRFHSIPQRNRAPEETTS